MAALVAVLLILAVVFASMQAFGVPGRVNWGWLAITLVILALATLPALVRL